MHRFVGVFFFLVGRSLAMWKQNLLLVRLAFGGNMQRNKIYKTSQWKKVREEVFKLDHYECVRCNHTLFNKKGDKTLTKAVLVHHIYPAREYPQYMYQIWVNGKRNLVSLCNDCHEELHNRKFNPSEHFTNEERYD